MSRVQLHRHKLGAQAFDLLPDRGPHIVSLDDSPEPPRGSDRLQPRHTGAEHENARRSNRARRGHEHGKHPRERIRGQNHRLVSGDGSHRRQGVHALRPRDTRDQFHGEAARAALGNLGVFRACAQRLAETDQDLA